MPNHIDEDACRLEVSEDLLSAESLSSGSSSKQKATLPRTSATSKPCAYPDRQQSSSSRAHKVAQLGSQVSLPFSPSIPCMAGRLKNYVHKWHTITSDQRILDAIRGVTIDVITKLSQHFVPNQYKFNPLEIRLLMSRLPVFLRGGSLREPHTQMESTFATFSYVRRKMAPIGLF